MSGNPLHGITLEMMLTRLVEKYGWGDLGERIRINCFNVDPSIKSSLTFLRRTPWARKKVEDLYLRIFTKPEKSVDDSAESRVVGPDKEKESETVLE